MHISAEFISWISTPTISTSFDFCALVKGRLMCIVLCPKVIDPWLGLVIGASLCMLDFYA